MGYILPIINSQHTQYGSRGLKIITKNNYVNPSRSIHNDLKFSDDQSYKGQNDSIRKVRNQLSTEKGKGGYIDLYI